MYFPRTFGLMDGQYYVMNKAWFFFFFVPLTVGGKFNCFHLLLMEKEERKTSRSEIGGASYVTASTVQGVI